MNLLTAYLGLVIVGSFIAYGIGLIIEKSMSVASLPTFLVMYFLSLGLSWFIAVKLTEPKAKTA